MRDYFDEEDFEEDEELTTRIQMEKEMKTREDFIKNCNAAYEAIKSDPNNILDEGNSATKRANLINALNRMSALFILQEEYEKCSTLKEFVESKIPGTELTPRISEVKKFLGLEE